MIGCKFLLCKFIFCKFIIYTSPVVCLVMNEEEKNVRIRVEKTVWIKFPDRRIYLTRTHLTIMIGLSVLYLDNPSFVQIKTSLSYSKRPRDHNFYLKLMLTLIDKSWKINTHIFRDFSFRVVTQTNLWKNYPFLDD